MKGVREQSFRDLEEPRHRMLYSQAVALLSEGRVGSAILRLEESLHISLSVLEECRYLCEGTRESEDETHRDLSEVVAEYYTQVLQCKQNCVLEDSVRLTSERSPEDVVVPQLSLLLDSYTRIGDLESAAQTANLLLLFHPNNESLKKRLLGYEERLQAKDGGKLQESIISYIHRAISEKKLLYYAMENLGISFRDPDSWTPEEIIPESLREKIRMEREEELENRGDLPYEQVTVTLTPKQMNGTRRVTLDGVIGEEECKRLLSLAQVYEGSGNGFKGRRSPHTPKERIQSLSVLRALQMASSGDVDLTHARLLYHTSERSRVLAQAYFAAQSLHFSYTHLVCRSAIEGLQEGREDPSHPVHVDNCLLDPEEKKCWKEPPAYIHRDYSGLLYLNEDFQGGDLFFTELDGTTVTAEIQPHCGRLVLFSAGEENPHGVRAVTQGTRCAIALFFTESEEHAEQERLQSKILMGEDDHSNKRNEEEDVGTGRETARTGRETARTGRETARTREDASSETARSSGRSHKKDEL
ncbi:prolyl 3-hydroxylase 3-like isoform 1-T2 [Discoglossus pictus]